MGGDGLGVRFGALHARDLTPVVLRERPRTALFLIEGFELRVDGRPVDLAMVLQRLLAFLALNDRPLLRTFVAGTLWLEAPEPRAGANLRSALWRLQRSGFSVVEATHSHVRLSPTVEVDIREARARAEELMDGSAALADGCQAVDPRSFSSDLLPDWYDEWVVMERERFRQLRLHALEALCRGLSAEGRHGEAVQAGVAAVAGEPLRESAHRALIEAHLAEGNLAEARRQYVWYRSYLRKELDARPSAGLTTLVGL